MTYWLVRFAFGALMLTPGAAISGFMRLSRVGPRLENEARLKPLSFTSAIAATVIAAAQLRTGATTPARERPGPASC